MKKNKFVGLIIEDTRSRREVIIISLRIGRHIYIICVSSPLVYKYSPASEIKFNYFAVRSNNHAGFKVTESSFLTSDLLPFAR